MGGYEANDSADPDARVLPDLVLRLEDPVERVDPERDDREQDREGDPPAGAPEGRWWRLVCSWPVILCHSRDGGGRHGSDVGRGDGESAEVPISGRAGLAGTRRNERLAQTEQVLDRIDGVPCSAVPQPLTHVLDRQLQALDERKLARILIETGEPAPSAAGATAGGDERRLCGIPAISRAPAA
jgi:hypothetical protein